LYFRILPYRWFRVLKCPPFEICEKDACIQARCFKRKKYFAFFGEKIGIWLTGKYSRFEQILLLGGILYNLVVHLLISLSAGWACWCIQLWQLLTGTGTHIGLQNFPKMETQCTSAKYKSFIT
jgi:hypothetical protein